MEPIGSMSLCLLLNLLSYINRMRKIYAIIFVLFGLLLSLPSSGQEKTPAFPGAEGFGRYVTGGRGGKVLHVTNLDNSGTGSLRWALSQSGARTIVFDVSGTIHLTSALKISSGSVTIAGQTAPGDGICVADYPVTIQANNVIVRYMRFRLGNNNVKVNGADGWDAFGALDQRDIIIDHCSVSWSIDECLSMGGCHDITVQWCLIAQSLQDAGHSKGSHGYGGNWGGSGASFHHNLMAHHESRVPRLGPRYTTQLDERMDMRNNVFYNWGGNGCYGGEAMNVNIVNNYYKPGPATNQISSTKRMRIACIGVRTNSYITNYPDYAPTLHKWGTFFVEGNKNSKYQTVTDDNWTYGVLNQFGDDNDGTLTDEVKEQMHLNEPIDFIYTTTHSADDAYEKVLLYAGASLQRDSYDTFIIEETENGLATYTGPGNHKGIIDSQENLKPSDAGDDWSAWPVLNSEAAPADSDGDGMPDTWETAHGLNPNDASDGNTMGTDGYTNLENYLNSLVEHITEDQNDGGTATGNIISDNDWQNKDNYVIAPSTNLTGWTFENGISINQSGAPAEGKGCGITGYKYSRNKKYTINLPDGMTIGKVEITGYSNVDNEPAWLAELNGVTYGETDYVFESRTTGASTTNTITLDPAASKTLTFTPGGQQVVWIITLYPVTTGIDEMRATTSDISNIYSIDGRLVKKNASREDLYGLPKGMYIQGGKQIVVR